MSKPFLFFLVHFYYRALFSCFLVLYLCNGNIQKRERPFKKKRNLEVDVEFGLVGGERRQGARSDDDGAAVLAHLAQHHGRVEAPQVQRVGELRHRVEALVPAHPQKATRRCILDATGFD